MRSNKTIQYLLNQHYPTYAEAHKQPLRVIKNIQAQQRCRTPDQGTSYYRCPDDGEEQAVYHSCRSRGCTVCGENKQHHWLEKQKQRLLNCPHYHLVFTLPHEYLPLWRYNRQWFIKAQFETVNETLKALLLGNQYKGKAYKGILEALSGYIVTLHTWGRSLSLHPHLHVLLTAGGLDKENHWNALEGDFLVAVKVLKSLYRGKFQAKIKAFIESEDVRFPKGEHKISQLGLYRALFQKEWSVRIQEKYAHGQGVLIYLSRYLGASAIKPEQIRLINHEKEVLFQYWSHREQKQICERLSVDVFLSRYLIHQPEASVHTVRYYGIYGGSAKKKRDISRDLLGETEYQQTAKNNDIVGIVNEVLCQCCGAVMQLVCVARKYRQKENPLIGSALGVIGYFDINRRFKASG